MTINKLGESGTRTTRYHPIVTFGRIMGSKIQMPHDQETQQDFDSDADRSGNIPGKKDTIVFCTGNNNAAQMRQS